MDWLLYTGVTGLFTGTLNKQGGRYKSWKRRKFSLVWAHLSYFDEKDQVIFSIPFSECSECSPVPHESRQFTFQLVTKNRNWLFQADNQHDLANWTSIIKAMIDLNSPRSKNVPLLVYMQNVAARTTQLTSTTPSLKVAQISKLITELSETYVCDLFRAAAATNKDQIREGCGTIKKKIDEILAISGSDISLSSFVSLLENLKKDVDSLHHYLDRHSASAQFFEDAKLKSVVKASPTTVKQRTFTTVAPTRSLLRDSGRICITGHHRASTIAPAANPTATNSSPNISSTPDNEPTSSRTETPLEEPKETTAEAVIRLAKQIRSLYQAQVEAVNKRDADVFNQCQTEIVQTFKLLNNQFKDIVSRLQSQSVVNLIANVPQKLFMPWKEGLDILRSCYENPELQTEEAAQKLAAINARFNDALQELNSAVYTAVQQELFENEIKFVTEEFVKSAETLSKHPEHTIVPKIHAVARGLVKLCTQYFSRETSLAENQLQEYRAGLDKASTALEKIMADCSEDKLDLQGIPKNLFLDVAAAIVDFARQLTSIIDAAQGNPLSASTRLQAASAVKRIHSVLVPLIEFVSNCSAPAAVSTPALAAPSAAASTATTTSQQDRPADTKPSDSEQPTEVAPNTDDVNIWDEPEEGNVIYMSTEKYDKDEPAIQAASLNKLILKLTNEKVVDIDFVKTFVLTYRSFTTSETFLRKLVERYNVPEWNPSSGLTQEQYRAVKVLPIRLRVCNVLYQWITYGYADMDNALLEQIIEFCKTTLVRDGHESLQKKIINLIERLGLEKRAKEVVNATYTRPRYRHNPAGSGPPLPNFRPMLSKGISQTALMPNSPAGSDPVQIAEQLTGIEWVWFQKIKPAELLDQAWSKPQLKHRAPNVLQLIARFNQVSAWCSSNIVWQEKLSDRVKMFARFINIAKHMFDMNNFNGAMAILSGLNSSSVHRLKFTIAELPKKEKQTLEFLQEKLSSRGSYKEYRAILHSRSVPILPYLGVYLTDLTFIGDGNPDKVKGLINFHKRRLTYKVISEIIQYQQVSHKITPDPTILPFLTQLTYASETELYNLSLLREPRNAERADIR